MIVENIIKVWLYFCLFAHFFTLGQIIPAICLVIASYVGCNHVAAVTAVTMSVGFAGCALSGYQVNHLDIAPPFAGLFLVSLVFIH